MARFRHISTKMVLVLDAGTEEGKKIRKRVTIGNIREDASSDALLELAEALGKLLEHPVAKVLLYKVEELEREAGGGDTGFALWASARESFPRNPRRSNRTAPVTQSASTSPKHQNPKPQSSVSVHSGAGNKHANNGIQEKADADNSRAAYSGVGADRGVGEARAAHSAGSPHCIRDDGDCARLWRKHAPAVYGKHAAMPGERAAGHAALPALRISAAENGRSPPSLRKISGPALLPGRPAGRLLWMKALSA